MNSKKFWSSVVAVCTIVAPGGRARALGLADDLAGAAVRAASVENFLHALPPELRGDYVLGYRPLGSQVGDATRPRGLLFGRDVVISFGACPGGRGHDHVEMMDLRRLRPRLVDIGFGRDGVEVRREPESCRHCHGEMNRPLWPTNAIPPGWPGFFGSAVSGLTFARESELLGEFKAAAARHPRYSALEGLGDLEAYGPRGKVLYDANKRFEEVVSRSVARNAFGYLRAHPNYPRARLPLLVALRAHDDFDDREFARVIAPWVGWPEARVLEAVARHGRLVSAAVARHAGVKWRHLEFGLAMKFSTGERARYGHGRVERLVRLAARLAWVSEVFGLIELETYLSTSTRRGTFAFPGHLAGVSGPAQLEDILFRDAVAQTALTADDVGREAWGSTRDFAAGLGRLGRALGVVRSCAFYFEN